LNEHRRKMMDALEISTFGEPFDVVEAEPGSPCAT
jgi:hypothetical protein